MVTNRLQLPRCAAHHRCHLLGQQQHCAASQLPALLHFDFNLSVCVILVDAEGAKLEVSGYENKLFCHEAK